MIIKLSEIPEEGKTYNFSNKTGELTASLNDLIQTESYVTEIFIKPLNSKDFELTGWIKTQTPQQCSRCGIDFTFKIDEKFHEIMIPMQIVPRDAKFSKPNHLSDSESDGLSVIEYENQIFNLGEYLHEVVAIAIPFNPAPVPNEKDECSICELPLKGKTFGYDEAMVEKESTNPFKVLKNIKLN